MNDNAHDPELIAWALDVIGVDPGCSHPEASVSYAQKRMQIQGLLEEETDGDTRELLNERLGELDEAFAVLSRAPQPNEPPSGNSTPSALQAPDEGISGGEATEEEYQIGRTGDTYDPVAMLDLPEPFTEKQLKQKYLLKKNELEDVLLGSTDEQMIAQTESRLLGLEEAFLSLQEAIDGASGSDQEEAGGVATPPEVTQPSLVQSAVEEFGIAVGERSVPGTFGPWASGTLLSTGEEVQVCRLYDDADAQIAEVGKTLYFYMRGLHWLAQLKGRVIQQQVIESEGRYALVREVPVGQTLREWMAQHQDPAGRVPYGTAREILASIVEVLVEVHPHGAHGALTPDMIWVDGGKVTLADFGAHLLLGSGLLRDNMLKLDPVYLSPERLGHGPSTNMPSLQEDQYSMGVIFYEMITGQQPVGNFAEASSIVKEIPKKVDQALLKALSADAGSRYPTLQDFYSEMERHQKSTKNITMKPMLVAASLAGVLAIAGLVLFTSGLFQEPPEDFSESFSRSEIQFQEMLESSITTPQMLRDEKRALRRLQDNLVFAPDRETRNRQLEEIGVLKQSVYRKELLVDYMGRDPFKQLVVSIKPVLAEISNNGLSGSDLKENQLQDLIGDLQQTYVEWNALQKRSEVLGEARVLFDAASSEYPKEVSDSLESALKVYEAEVGRFAGDVATSDPLLEELADLKNVITGAPVLLEAENMAGEMSVARIHEAYASEVERLSASVTSLKRRVIEGELGGVYDNIVSTHTSLEVLNRWGEAWVLGISKVDELRSQSQLANQILGKGVQDDLDRSLTFLEESKYSEAIEALEEVNTTTASLDEFVAQAQLLGDLADRIERVQPSTDSEANQSSLFAALHDAYMGLQSLFDTSLEVLASKDYELAKRQVSQVVESKKALDELSDSSFIIQQEVENIVKEIGDEKAPTLIALQRSLDETTRVIERGLFEDAIASLDALGDNLSLALKVGAKEKAVKRWLSENTGLLDIQDLRKDYTQVQGFYETASDHILRFAFDRALEKLESGAEIMGKSEQKAYGLAYEYLAMVESSKSSGDSAGFLEATRKLKELLPEVDPSNQFEKLGPER